MRKSADMKQILLLTLAATLLAGCKDPNSNPGTDPNEPPTKHDVMTYITTADNTMHFDKVGKNFIEGLNMSPEITLTLDPKSRFQVFDGFGAAITGASAFNLSQMPADARAKLLKETFSVSEGMGYSYVRVPIGGSDFNVHSNYDYTCCDQGYRKLRPHLRRDGLHHPHPQGDTRHQSRSEGDGLTMELSEMDEGG